MKNTYLVLFILFFISINLFSQNDQATVVKDAPIVYVKCWQCDMDRMKREINFVNYARQRQDADIVVIVTSQGTGTGSKYSIYFEGQNSYMGINDTLSLNVSDTDTEKIIDDKLLEKIKYGLLPYMMNSPLKEKINYSVGVNATEKIEKTVDPWDSWVFSTGLRGSFNGASRYNNKSLYGSLSANRVTKKDKWSFYSSVNYSQRNYYFPDSNNVIIDSLTITSERKNNYVYGKYVYSLNDHWSIGGFGNGFSNTYSNYDLGIGAKLGLEYNFYNFEESDRRSVILTYYIGSTYNDYVDTTIYGKLKENLFEESFSLSIYQKQKWGNLDFGASFSSYLHDIRINSLTFNTNVSWNVFKGFTFSLGGYLSFVNNQISLPKEGTDVIGTVLGDRILATDYNAYTYVGIRYTFGSKYANVVNPRFNSGGSVTYYFY